MDVASNQGRPDPTRVLDFFAHTTAATFSVLPSQGKPGAAESDEQRSGAKRSVTRASASNRIGSHYSLPAAALRLQGGVAVDPHRPSSLPQLKGALRSTPGSGAHQQILVMGFHDSIAAVSELVTAALTPDAEAARARGARRLLLSGDTLPPPLLAAPGIPRRRPVLTFGGGGSGAGGSPRRGSVVGDSYRTEAPPDPAPPPPAPALRCARVQLRMERFLADEGAVPAGAAAPFNAVVFAAAAARAKAVGLRGLPPLPLSKVRRGAGGGRL